ncbi:MAG: DNA polymerase I [Clostridia bacterium]|nr:DNA polymerase I [Clostridia bacterium]
MKTLMLVDGNSILNRAFYGIPLLTNQAGIHTNAVYGFFNILLRHMEKDRPDELCVAFDVKAPTYRHELYADYKAGRRAMPDELREQFPIVKQLLDAMGISRFEQAGLEADDIIGILSRRADEAEERCVIVTGDRDTLQLISDRVVVRLATTSPKGPSDTLYDKAMLQEKYGLTPAQMIDLKALMGDSSDRIPGVAGVGEKTALNLLHQYGDLDNTFAHVEDLKGALKTKMENGKESAYLSKKLGTIVTESDIDVGDLSVKEANAEELKALLDEYQLAKLASKLNVAAAAPTQKPAFTSPKKTEFDGKLPDGIPAVFVENEQAYLYIGSQIITSPLSDGLLNALSGRPFIAHDAKPLIRKMEHGGYEARCEFDTMLALYVLDPSRASKQPEDVCEKELGITASREDFAALLPRLKEKLTAELKENNAEFLYYEIELPLCSVLARMEDVGFKADKEFLEKFSEELGDLLVTLERQVQDLAGKEFNIYSPKQLSEVLFTDLLLPPGKKTKTGYSTDNDTLEKLTKYHPIAQAVIDCRRIAKLKSTYADGLAEKVGDDGRIHTIFMQAVTQTGRISSVEPNLQNIPIRTDLGRQLRRAFSAEDGCLLVDADYSQIELRILSHIADDKAMQQAFIDGEDIHTATASQVFDLPMEMITPELRRRAKAVNFGIVYGIGDYSLGQDLHVSRKEAKQYIESYLETYTGVRDFMKDIVEFGKEHGYVETVFHRRRYVPELKASGHLRAFGERVCMNAPIQGTAADVIKYAMVKIDRRLKEEKMKTRLILQIHDELILEAPEEEAEKAARLLKEEMESAATLKVPLSVDSNTAKNWFDAK